MKSCLIKHSVNGIADPEHIKHSVNGTIDPGHIKHSVNGTVDPGHISALRERERTYPEHKRPRSLHCGTFIYNNHI